MAEDYIGNALRGVNQYKQQQFQNNLAITKDNREGQLQDLQINALKTNQAQTAAKMNFEQSIAGARLVQAAAQKGQDPKAVAEQVAPKFVQDFEAQHGQGSWSQLQPQDVVKLAQGIEQHSMAQLGQGPQPQQYQVVGKDQALLAKDANTGALSPTPVFTNEEETFKDQAQPMSLNGKPAMAQVGSKGTVRPVPGATPYNKPSIYGDGASSDASKEFAYQTFNETGKLPPGLAPRSDTAKAALMEYISKRAGEEGNSAAQLAAHGQAFQAKQQALKSYASGGKNNTMLQSTSTAIAHMDTMVELAQAMENGDSQTVNKIKNAWKSEFGTPMPGNMDAAAQLVGTEVIKAMVAGGGGQEERIKAEKAFANYKNLDSIKGVVDTYTHLLGGQIDTKRNDFVQGDLGSEDAFNKRFLTPRARKALGVGDAQAPQPVQPGEQTATNAAGQKIVLRGGQWVPL